MNFIKKVSLLILLFISGSVISQSFSWGGRFGGNGETVVRKMHVDEDGTSYTTGYFTDTADFDITSSDQILTANGFYDAFVQKTNSDGTLEWAVGFGGEFFEYGTGITTDTDGNVYITGYFDETTDFDPGPGEFTLVAQGGGDIFILKLDPTGAFVWAKTVGGSDYEESTSIEVDELGNVYVLGYIYNEVDFNPGADEFLLASQGGADTFLLMLDSEGLFVNAFSYGGTDQDLSLELSVKSSTEIFLSGFFTGNADLDPRPLNEYYIDAADNYVGYTMQINATGEIVNISNTQGGNVTVYTVVHDSENNMYIAGNFDGTVNFDPSSSSSDYVFTSLLASNGFIMKVTADGSVAWARHLESDEFNYVYDMEIGTNNEVYTTGFFGGTTDFNPSLSENFMLTKESGSAADAFLLALDSDGLLIDAYQFGGVDFIDTHQMGVDGTNTIYLAAQFDLTVDINPLPSEILEVTSTDFRDSYLFKFTQEQLNVSDFNDTTINAFPNPVHNELFLASNDELVGVSYQIYNMLGQKVSSGILTQEQNILVASLDQGVYSIKLPNKKALKFIKR